MLNHISPVFSPELLAAVYAMGHGDTIVLADGNFPSDGVSRRGAAEIIRADGHGIPELLDAILALMPLDTYAEKPVLYMAKSECDRDLADIRRELVNAGYIKEKTQGKRQKQPAARKPLRFVSDSGTEILVGRGNVQNDELTLHIARRTDLWLHVQKLPGSHVIVSQAEGEADEETIRQAAALAATYSQAKTGGKVAVDCTQVRFVKKPSGAKPGRVIYTDYRTIITAADEALAERLRKD